jgi:hypothetical protein
MALNKPVVTARIEAEALTQEGVVATVEQVVVEPVAVVEKAEAAEVVEPAAAEVVEPAAAAEPVAKTDVAVVTEAGAVSVVEQRTNAMAQFTKDQAEGGYEGMELTSFSFDRIKLHEGMFKLGSDETELGTNFDAVVLGTRNLYVVRQNDDNDAKSFYSYDAKGLTHSDGSSSAEMLAEWADEGYGIEGAPLDIRGYLEAMALLVNRDDEFNQNMVSLSIPPASKARMAGMAFQASSRLKCELNGAVLRFEVGKKVGEGVKAFRPWVMKLVGAYTA